MDLALAVLLATPANATILTPGSAFILQATKQAGKQMNYLQKTNTRLRIVLPILLLALSWDASLAAANETIEQCAALASQDEQIQCLEAAVLKLSGETAAPEVVVEEPMPQAEVVASPEPVPEPAPMPVETIVVESDSQPTPPVSEAIVATDMPKEAPAAGVDELGAEQVAVLKGETVETPRTTAIVTRHAEVGYQKVRVWLDNGQIWQQTDGDRVRAIRKLRNDPTFAVELWKTRSGGYRMYIPSKNLTLRVKRLQ